MLFAVVLTFAMAVLTAVYAIMVLLRERPPRAEPPPPAPVLRLRGVYARFGDKPDSSRDQYWT